MDCGKVRLLGMLIAMVLAIGGAGCASFGEATAKGAVLGSYEGYQELKKQNPELGVTKILEDPAFREAARDITKSFVVGAGDGYDEAKFEQKADKLVRTMLVAAREEGNEAVGQLITEQGPRLQFVLRQTLSTSIRTAGAELRAAAVHDGSAAVTAIMTAALDALSAQLDPKKTAPLKLVTKELMEAIGSGLVAGLREELANPETQVAIADLTKSATSGARDGFLKSNSDSKAIWITLAILFGAFFVLAIVALLFYVRKSVLSGRALTVVAQQINQDADREGNDEIKKRIRKRAIRAGVEGHLSGFLKDRGL